jgi:hypothetical protein
MKDELITPDNLSKELLKSVLDAAYMETSFDNEGRLIVKERVTCLVFPNQEQKDSVELVALFNLKPETSELLRLQAANRINAEYIADLVNTHLNDAIFLDIRKHMMKKNCKKLQ